MSLKDKIEAREAQICIIGLVNELALLSERMGIDIWEVIEPASTKPFGFMPFYYAWVVKHAPLIIDTVNATRGVSEGREKILRIGVPTFEQKEIGELKWRSGWNPKAG